ncbi:hypothetical protein OsI_38556 [Oryza sativa Indica Group]|uniref:PHD-type domain-containing protein n=1 Tax=Oryza sativa subsp. indica TaxID=39946 RepID=B8BM84_ORYSI|nr:hypothetical protein OsI_38556 [Oryza sativa Indica Group]
MCRICFSGENEGSTKAAKMLPCKLCNKKYHRSCLKNWGEHRDLFHWSSWVCPSCRSCEVLLDWSLGFDVNLAKTLVCGVTGPTSGSSVCRRPGDPNKLMFCKRCDGAYHCYCQQPSHKNVTHGPYLCPKHTRCHSCGSGVPGSGHSTRWFLGYTCCDACGRLFVKGNYCPVCLKVYRDSEVIPMVCCDVCEKWVHIECDGISEEKYQQFQSDQNLQYTCGACRGECSQIRDTEDAVRELWKRRDVVDHDLMASLRAAAALPSLEDVSPSHPNSDDEKLGAYVMKNDGRNTLKFSFKSNSTKPALDSSEQEKNAIKSSGSNKKHSKKKGNQNNKTVSEQDEIFLEKRNETKSLGSLGDQIADVTRDKSSFKNDADAFVLSSAQSAEKALKLQSAKAAAHNADMIPKVKIKGTKVPSLHFKDVGEENAAKSDTGKERARAGFNTCLKPSLLKLKFKRPIFEQPSTQSSQPEEPGTWASPQEELNVAKGQRSKRKRPSLDKMDGSESKAPAAKRHEQSTGEEAMDANWILRKLGKDAIGKRIEVQLASDGKWHQGVVSNVINGTLCLQLDNGRSENIELGKRAIRLIAQSQLPATRVVSRPLQAPAFGLSQSLIHGRLGGLKFTQNSL